MTQKGSEGGNTHSLAYTLLLSLLHTHNLTHTHTYAHTHTLTHTHSQKPPLTRTQAHPLKHVHKGLIYEKKF